MSLDEKNFFNQMLTKYNASDEFKNSIKLSIQKIFLLDVSNATKLFLLRDVEETFKRHSLNYDNLINSNLANNFNQNNNLALEIENDTSIVSFMNDNCLKKNFNENLTNNLNSKEKTNNLSMNQNNFKNQLENVENKLFNNFNQNFNSEINDLNLKNNENQDDCFIEEKSIKHNEKVQKTNHFNIDLDY
ncbi:MAG: hypothetical protein ACOC3X_03925 [Nanoarchaeota archaeon]